MTFPPHWHMNPEDPDPEPRELEFKGIRYRPKGNGRIIERSDGRIQLIIDMEPTK